MSQVDSTHLSQEVLSGLSRFQVKARRGARSTLDTRRPSAVLCERVVLRTPYSVLRSTGPQHSTAQAGRALPSAVKG